MAIPVSELQKLNPSARIELFVLELVEGLHYATGNPSNVPTIYRFHSGTNMNTNANIIWQGNTYTKFPVIAEGFEYVGRGTLPRPTLTVSNVLGTITALMATANATTPFNDLQGAKLIRHRTMAQFLDAANFPSNQNPSGTPSSTTELPQEIYFIDKKLVENREVVQFECVSALDLENIRAPKRQVTKKDFPSVGSFI